MVARVMILRGPMRAQGKPTQALVDLVFCLFSVFMQFRKLVCDNLGGNKPALSSAKERASLR